MIQINDLHFSYRRQQALFNGLTLHLEAFRRQQELFNGLSLHLEPGSITGLLGKNGAGKTTLLKLVAGLLHPQSGEISVLDHHPHNREVSFLSDLFFVPEEFFLPSISIRDYKEAYAPFYPRFDHPLFARILEEFELMAENNLQRHSHGQKKKFLIAFALSTRCRLLLLDEPTNGLDIPSKSLFRKVLAGSLDENQLVIISTHQVKDVENLIDQIIILDNGKMIFQQTIAEISQKVSFVSGNSGETEGSIYSEAVPGGYRMMVPNSRSETDVDIELLFNAIINGKKIG